VTDGVVQFIGVDLDALLFKVVVEFFEFASFGGWKKVEMVDWFAFIFCVPFVDCVGFIFLLEDAGGSPGTNLHLPMAVPQKRQSRAGKKMGRG